jgi:hypothetical protein
VQTIQVHQDGERAREFEQRRLGLRPTDAAQGPGRRVAPLPR